MTERKMNATCRRNHPRIPGEARCRACAREYQWRLMHPDAVEYAPAPANRDKRACVHGHTYTPENTYRDTHGFRQCRMCRQTRRQTRQHHLLREQLAAYAHEAWAGWMRYLFDKSTRNADGSVTISPGYVAGLQRQVRTPYADLAANEQEYDRAEADKMPALMRKAAMS